MNGLEFLKQFGKLQPDTSRILLSGEDDINALIRTINETHAYRFIAKPWDKDELLSSIHHALAYRDLIMEKRRQLATRPTTRLAVTYAKHPHPFQIVLVDGDDYLLRLISRGLMDERTWTVFMARFSKRYIMAPTPGNSNARLKVFIRPNPLLPILRTHPCDLIIAAQTLPDMDGIVFLSKMRQVIPDAARILISNAPDKSLVMQAVNEAEVQGMLQLQWVNYELRADARRQAWNLHQIKTAAIQALACRELLPGDPL